MRTMMSVDDNNPFNWPTQCDYVTWWAPEVGGKVKETKYATYRERGDEQGIAIRAQNTLIECFLFEGRRLAQRVGGPRELLYLGVIFVILLPCTPSPAMSPFWPKMKA